MSIFRNSFIVLFYSIANHIGMTCTSNTPLHFFLLKKTYILNTLFAGK